MRIAATFTGKSSVGTMGYEKGRRYVLILSDKKGMDVRRIDGSGLCMYESLSAFLNNWTNIRVLKEYTKNERSTTKIPD